MMSRNGMRLQGMLLICGLLVSCDDTSSTGKKDTRTDGSTRDGSTHADLKAKDLGSGTLTCNKILDCQAACASSDTACSDKCLGQGLPAAQQHFNALDQCSKTAQTGTCKTRCANPSTTDCFLCIDQACADELHYCLFGDPRPGFGETCTDSSTCQEGLTCEKIVTTSAKGFCTLGCTGTDHCQGAPLGTFARCNRAKPSGGKFCGFVCKMTNASGLQEYPCPSAMKCSTIEVSAGMGVFLCKESE
jgi:hypothetical protein